MLGEFGFLTQHNVRSICAAKQYVRDMKSKFGIREFLFDNVLESYWHPPDNFATIDSWQSSCFTCNHQRVDKAVVQAYVDEVQNSEPIGRAWLRVDATAQDSRHSVPAGLDLLGHLAITAGQHNATVVMNVIKPNAALASHITQRWVDFAENLGFQGIHWANEGNFRGCQGCDWRNFLATAAWTLRSRGLVQNLDFVDGFQYDDSLFVGNNTALLQFPFWSVNSGNLSTFFNVPRRGVIWDHSPAFRNYMLEQQQQAPFRVVDMVARLMEQAHCSAGAKSYAAIADGARSVYLGDNRSLDLSASQVQALETQGMRFHGCQNARWYVEKNMTAIQEVHFLFEMGCEHADSAHLAAILKNSLAQVGLSQSQVDNLTIITGVDLSSTSANWLTASGRLQLTVESRDATAVSGIRTSIDRLAPVFLSSQTFQDEVMPYLRAAGCEDSLMAWWNLSVMGEMAQVLLSREQREALGNGREEKVIPLCGHEGRETATSTTAAARPTLSPQKYQSTAQNPLWADIMGGIVLCMLCCFCCFALYVAKQDQAERQTPSPLLSQAPKQPMIATVDQPVQDDGAGMSAFLENEQPPWAQHFGPTVIHG